MTVAEIKERRREREDVAAQRIKVIKERKNLTDADLGELMGMSASQISERLRPGRSASISTGELLDFADALGVPVHILIEGTPADFEQSLIDLGLFASRWTPISAGKAA